MMPDPKKPVTIESLLHLKRSERPPEEFWVQFESELRAKQLAAIVGPRPWYAASNLRGLFRAAPVGFGVAAALGAVVFSLHQVHSPVSARMASSPVAVAAAQPVLRPDVKVSAVTVAAAGIAAARVAPVRSAPVAPSAASDALGTTVAMTTNSLRASFPDPFSGEVNLSAAPADAGSALTNATSQWTQVAYTPHNAQTEPLTRTETPADERRAALMSAPLGGTTPIFATATMVSAADDRSVSQLSDERLSQAVRRLGVGGGGVLIRF